MRLFNTGHTEGVQMIFNPAVVSYKELLMVLFDRMDPTTLNRQEIVNGRK